MRVRVKRGKGHIIRKVKVNRIHPIKKEVINMEYLCKEECFAMSPLDGSSAFIVKSDKVSEFMNKKKDKTKIANILKKASKNKIGVHE
jgi:hypothetical protein